MTPKELSEALRPLILEAVDLLVKGVKEALEPEIIVAEAKPKKKGAEP